MEKAVIVLLVFNAAVGLLLLLIACGQYRQLKGFMQRGNMPDAPSSARINALLQAASKPLSPTEKKYLQLFSEGKTTEEISEIMHVEPSSVYTMRYRVRKKFPEGYNLPF